MQTIKKTAAQLKIGDVIVNLDNGETRTVLRDSVPTRAAGYVWVTTSGAALNCHGSTVVGVQVRR